MTDEPKKIEKIHRQAGYEKFVGENEIIVDKIDELVDAVNEMRERLDRLWMGSMPSFMDHLKARDVFSVDIKETKE